MFGLSFRAREELIYTLHDLIQYPEVYLLDDTLDGIPPSFVEWRELGVDALGQGSVYFDTFATNEKQTYLANPEPVEIYIDIYGIAKYLVITSNGNQIDYIHPLVKPIDLNHYSSSGVYIIPPEQLKIYI